MKRILKLLVLCLFSYTVQANDYKLVGEVEQAAGKQVELIALSGMEQLSLDTQVVDVQNRFEFKLESPTAKPGMYVLRFVGTNKFASLFFNNEDIEMVSSFENFAQDLIFVRSEENVALLSFYETYNALNQQLNILKSVQTNELASPAFVKSLLLEKERLAQESATFVTSFMAENAHLYVSAYIKSNFPVVPPEGIEAQDFNNYLLEHFWDPIDLQNPALIHTNLFVAKMHEYIKLSLQVAPAADREEGLIRVINELNDDLLEANVKVRTQLATNLAETFKNSGMERVYVEVVDKFVENDLCVSDNKGKYVNRAEQFKRLAAGKIAPNISFDPKLPGEIGSLDQFKASKILLIFWATDCPHCTQAMPELYQLYQSYKNKGLEVVAVAIGKTQQEYQNMTQNWQWHNFYPAKEWKSKVVKDYYIYGTPSMFLLDGATREILAKPAVPQQLENYLRTKL